MGKTADDVKALEEKLVKIVPLLEAISKGNVQNRNMVTEVMEHQGTMLEHQMSMMDDLTAIREDMSAIRKALLFVFETAISTKGSGLSANDRHRAARHIEELTRNGINALAKHNTTEALNILNKIKASSGGSST